MDALVAAYDTSPELEARRANLRATDETVAQALSGWRPRVTATGAYGRQSIRTEQPAAQFGVPGPNRHIDRTISPIVTELRISQPIYRGGQTVSATRQADAGVRAGRELLIVTEQSVLLDAITAYVDVVRDMAVVELNHNQVEVLKRQLQASDDRFRVGEITRTSVAQSEARLSNAISNLAAAQALLIASKSAYERVTGHQPGDLEEPPALPAVAESEEAAQQMAIERHPQLRAALEVERASEHAVRVEIGKLLPVISMDATAGLAQDQSVEGFAQDQIGVTAQLQVPLYESGAVYAAVRQAREINSQRRLEAAQTRRQVIEGVRNAWEGLRSARARIASDNDAVRANQSALEGVRQEAEVGARTTLDVLDAEQELLNSQVSLVRSKRNEVVASYSLLSFAAGLTAQSLGMPVEIYDPVAHYNEVRGKMFGTRADTGAKASDAKASPTQSSDETTTRP